MERTKYFITIILFTFFFIACQAAQYKSMIYRAFISNDMNKWQLVIDEMQKATPKNNEFLMELLNYQYGYIGWCLGNDKNDLAKNYLSIAEDNLYLLEKGGYKLSLVNAYKSAFYGYHIGLNVLKAPFIGSNSIECAKLAIELDKKNPYGYIQLGNSEFYMPSVFGGSKKVALQYFNTAEELMQLNLENIKEDWNYLSLLTLIAQAHIELKNYDQAGLYYQKILKIEPSYTWVKSELYPQLLQLNKNTTI